MKRITLLVVLTLVFACAAASDAESDRHDALMSESERKALQAVDSDIHAEPPEEADRESKTPPGGHWWGQIQERADDAYEELESEIGVCLQRLGDGPEVREIGLEARRDEAPGSDYELVAYTSYPTDAADEDCVSEVAQQYVDAVGPGLFDDFEAFVATFVHRGDGAPGCEGLDGICIEMGAQSIDAEDDGDVSSCREAARRSINAAMRQQSRCWSAANFRDRLKEFEDRPIELRAVLFGTFVVEDAASTIELRFNRPWVEPMVTCIDDGLDAQTLEIESPEPGCEGDLLNRAIYFWFGPAFTYIQQ